MSNYIDHAKQEFKAVGYTPLDQKQEAGPNKWIQENIFELLEVFGKQGHSGASAPQCVRMFEKLANFKPLTPIKCTDDEWGETISNEDHYQNKRLFSVFKEGKDGKPYYLDAITWKTQKGFTYTGSAFDGKGNVVKSRQFIKLPFTPKTFVIDVIEKEIKKDDWEFYIKDDSQLDEVYKYYEKGK